MRNFVTSRGPVLLAMLAGCIPLACCSALAQQRHTQRPSSAMRQPSFFQQRARPAFGGPGMQAQARFQPHLQSQHPAPIERRPPPSSGPANPPRNGEHLAQWMNQHRDLSPAQQQQALENEPGFHELPPRTQQRVRDRLAQLNAMPPQQRERWERHTEAMERLTLPQRAEVRGVMQQLGSLPPLQRQFVARSFRELRQLPPGQRSAMMNSYGVQSQMNDAQRSTLHNLMRIEPLIPPD